jgi:YVTN family beta-propeller protein
LAAAGFLLMTSSILAATSVPGYHLVKKMEVGGDGGWDYLTVDNSAHRLYLSRSNRVIVVNTETGAVVSEIPNTAGVHGITLDPKLNRGFTSNGGDNTVSIFDLKTLKETGRVSVGNRPDAIIFDPVSNRVFTFNGGSHDSTAIDASSEKVVGTVELGGKPEFAVSDGKGTIFVNIEDKSEIVAFDPKTLSVKHHWSLSPGEGPSGLSMDRAHRRLFSVCENGMMVVMDADSGHVIATPAIGRGPDASAFDPKTGLAFSSNGQDGTLTLVHEVTPDNFDVAANVPTQTGARTMTLDPKTHAIYLVTARFAPPTAAESNAPRRRPSMIPGSFVVLVFGP